MEIKGRSSVSPAPVIISGHGGGNWYNFRDGSARLLVDRAQGPLRFYQFSVQQVTSELRGAQHVSFFGTKYEGNDPMLMIRDSDHVRLFGHGGNAKGRADASLFVVRADDEFPVRQRRGRPDEDRHQEPQPSGRQHRPAPLAHAHRPPGQGRRIEAARHSNALSSTSEAHRGSNCEEDLSIRKDYENDNARQIPLLTLRRDGVGGVFPIGGRGPISAQSQRRNDAQLTACPRE